MKKRKILIVDDERGVRALLSKELECDDFEIDVAESGIKAIRSMSEKNYNMVITDYLMPDMDGLELTELINEKYPEVPVLMISGKMSSIDLTNSGVKVCLEKPCDLSELKFHMYRYLSGDESGDHLSSEDLQNPSIRTAASR